MHTYAHSVDESHKEMDKEYTQPPCYSQPLSHAHMLAVSSLPAPVRLTDNLLYFNNTYQELNDCSIDSSRTYLNFSVWF